MAQKKIGTVSHTDSSGKTWDRNVYRDTSTGETSRGYGPSPSGGSTNRPLGNTSSNGAAIGKAQSDLSRGFKR